MFDRMQRLELDSAPKGTSNPNVVARVLQVLHQIFNGHIVSTIMTLSDDLGHDLQVVNEIGLNPCHRHNPYGLLLTFKTAFLL